MSKTTEHKPDTLNVCQHFMHSEKGEYLGVLRFVPEDVAAEMFAALKSAELLIRVNAPLQDCCPLHKQIKAALAKAQ